MNAIDVAYRIFAEITVIPADAQAAKVIALVSQAVAQARVDAITQCAIEAGERSPEGVSSHTMLGDMWDKRIAKERDLAAIAKGPHRE